MSQNLFVHLYSCEPLAFSQKTWQSLYSFSIVHCGRGCVCIFSFRRVMLRCAAALPGFLLRFVALRHDLALLQAPLRCVALR
jgi:hypothetical protein